VIAEVSEEPLDGATEQLASVIASLDRRCVDLLDFYWKSSNKSCLRLKSRTTDVHEEQPMPSSEEISGLVQQFDSIENRNLGYGKGYLENPRFSDIWTTINTIVCRVLTLSNDPDYDVSDFLGQTGSCCMALNMNTGKLQEILEKAPERWCLSKPAWRTVKKRVETVAGLSGLFMAVVGTEKLNSHLVPKTTL
jgi:hypothetical protein